MTNAQSKLIPKFHHIPVMGRVMADNLKRAGITSKHAKRIRVRIDEEKDEDDIEFWNNVVTGKRQVFVTRESI